VNPRRKQTVLVAILIGEFAASVALIAAPLSHPTESHMATIQFIFGCVAVVALVVSLWIARYGWGKKLSDGDSIKVWQAAIVAGWLVLPPLYFWMEYFWLYKPTLAAAAASDLELFKYGQDVSSKIWIAVTSALALLYFWKDLKE
jgi:hypothetical protein